MAFWLTETLSNEGKMMEMGEESLRIVARHDIEDTLTAFGELYEALLPYLERPALQVAKLVDASELAASVDTEDTPVSVASYKHPDTLAFSEADSPEPSMVESRTGL